MKPPLVSVLIVSAMFAAACDGAGPNLLRPSATGGPSSVPHTLDNGWEVARGDKVTLCHATGNQTYFSITVSAQAQLAHRAHGDAEIGEPVPGQPGMIFSAGCAATPAITARSVTSGYVSFTDEPGIVILTGNGFELHFGWFPDVLSGSDEPWWERCGPGSGCAPGTLVDFGTMVYGVSDRFVVPGSAVLGNVVYDDVFFNAQLTFRGPTGMLPPAAPPDSSGCSLEGPFAFEGRIDAYTDQTRSGAPVFSLHLVGSGQASADFYAYQGRFYSDTELRYQFEP